ncbi:MAG: helix-turn-helix transcriptional regulator [Proteobacteria bacterium]|nr:helix-turn-helix transcriptional regulator [Pseudomonadota bacterium]
MNETQAVTALSALAHRHRLQIFRLLVVAGPTGVPAGEIAEAIGINPTALTFHLKELANADLATATREGRYVRYALHVDGMRRVIRYLTEDCCQGRKELCGLPTMRGRETCKPRAARERA